jgi:hypothetical protein
MTSDPQEFARLVAAAMLRIRGYSPALAPRDVRDDVFAVMADDPDYSRLYAEGVAPETAALAIQHRAWDATPAV